MRKQRAGYISEGEAAPQFRHCSSPEAEAQRKAAAWAKGNNADAWGYEAEAEGYKAKWPKTNKGGGGDGDYECSWKRNNKWVAVKKDGYAGDGDDECPWEKNNKWVKKDGYASGQDEDMPQATDDGDPSSSSCRPYKGEGKGGSLGTPIPCNYAAGSCKSRWDLLHKEEEMEKKKKKEQKKAPPAPSKCNSVADVQAMFDDGYYQMPTHHFWNGNSVWDVDTGTHLLWKNVPKGKNGGDSTKTEVFHGVCHGWDDKNYIYAS